MCVGVCVAKPVAVELRCHATALILLFCRHNFVVYGLSRLNYGTATHTYVLL